MQAFFYALKRVWEVVVRHEVSVNLAIRNKHYRRLVNLHRAAQLLQVRYTELDVCKSWTDTEYGLFGAWLIDPQRCGELLALITSEHDGAMERLTIPAMTDDDKDELTLNFQWRNGVDYDWSALDVGKGGHAA